jgi:hypothetical protein
MACRWLTCCGVEGEGTRAVGGVRRAKWEVAQLTEEVRRWWGGGEQSARLRRDCGGPRGGPMVRDGGEGELLVLHRWGGGIGQRRYPFKGGGEAAEGVRQRVEGTRRGAWFPPVGDSAGDAATTGSGPAATRAGGAASRAVGSAPGH